MEWYTSNPGYHEIPAGYGLPWNTPEEEFIPGTLVYESQMALTRAQLASQAPDCDGACLPLPTPPTNYDATGAGDDGNPFESQLRIVQHEEEWPGGEPEPMVDDSYTSESETADANESIVVGGAIATDGTPLPNWPDESCFVPASPQAVQPACLPHDGPVLSHTRIYHGTDSAITQALKSYAYFRDDARFGGWESYL